MIVAQVAEFDAKNFVLGGMAFADVDQIEDLDERCFDVQVQSLRNPEIEKSVLAALQNVMRTPIVNI